MLTKIRIMPQETRALTLGSPNMYSAISRILSSRISSVNDLENVHWEFDNSIMDPQLLMSAELLVDLGIVSARPGIQDVHKNYWFSLS